MLGVGIFSVAPKPSDELSIETPKSTASDFTLPADCPVKGMAEDNDGNLYIVDGTDDNTVLVGYELEDGSFKKTREFTLPKDTQKT